MVESKLEKGLFTVPRFSLAAYDTGYPVTFVVMFLTAYITGTFAIRYKEQARQSEKIAKRTKILFDTDQLLSKAENKLAILQTAGQQINKLLGRSIVIFDHEGGRLSEPILFISDEQRFYDEETELAIAEWVLQNNHNAGATTKNFPDAQYLYLAVRVNERIYRFILQNVWGSSWENDIGSLRVFMATLRKKLEKTPGAPQYIQTHIGVGYRMQKVE